jgi:hypothetical protein
MMCIRRILRKKTARYRLVDTIWSMTEHIIKTEKRLSELENKKTTIDIITDELKRIEQDQRISEKLSDHENT